MHKMKNKLHNTFLVMVLVMGGLAALHFLPVLSLGGSTLRKVDLLSDVRRKVKDNDVMGNNMLSADVMVSDTDTVAPLPVVKPPFIDSCKSGMVCIEDYSDSTSRGMAHFYEALSELSAKGGSVRVAYFGDSYIEGDILTADLRRLLQKEYGGRGVGYVPVTSRVSKFRPTVKHQFGGWKSHNVTDTIGFARSKQDISNNYFQAKAGAYVSLEGMKKYAAGLDTCSVSSFFYLTDDSLRLTALVNGKDKYEFNVVGDSTLQCSSVKGKIGSVKWTVDKASEKALFYAVTMDSEKGVAVDNFSTRGSSGQQISGIPMSVLKRYNELRKYNLIVLQYGLNVAFEGGVNYNYYKEGMKPIVNMLKKAFPESSILIVGIGDRETKDEDGNLRTMPGVKNLIKYQQALAAETNVAFWNLYEAMGGEGSIVEMVNSKPAMANYDYTHINFNGGKYIADLLFEALSYGKEQYEKRKAYEAE